MGDSSGGSNQLSHTERHVSIQTKLEDLEMLVDLSGREFRGVLHVRVSRTLTGLSVFASSAGRKSCPLCSEDKFKACYSHKLRRHLQNLHWKVYVEFEGRLPTPRLVP